MVNSKAFNSNTVVMIRHTISVPGLVSQCYCTYTPRKTTFLIQRCFSTLEGKNVIGAYILKQIFLHDLPSLSSRKSEISHVVALLVISPLLR